MSRCVLALLLVGTVAAQDGARLDAARVAGAEFAPKSILPVRWLDAAHYAAIARNPKTDYDEIVAVEAETGATTVLVASYTLRPIAKSGPVRIDDFARAPRGGEYLLFVDAQRVWRQKTRGEYYRLHHDSAAAPRRLGMGLPRGSLQFAKFSPDGTRIAYASGGDLYVELDATGAPKRLTEGGSSTLVHGTFDWVYEEEFDCRDGFQWSPDGTRLAFWQLDSSGVQEFPLLDNLSGPYARVTTVRYPKAGTPNSACRIGIVDVASGAIVWAKTEGDPRETYLPRLAWHPNGKELAVQWLPRSQQELRVLAVDAATGDCRVVATESDPAWVDVRDEFAFVRGGEAFVWTSDRDGWRHVWEHPWAGGEPALRTPGDFDVVRLLQVDDDGERLWFSRARKATELQLATASRDGVAFVTRSRARARTGEPAPELPSGWHEYDLAPGGQLAIHLHSSFDSPPEAEVVRLPDHERVRGLHLDDDLRRRHDALARGPHEFLALEIEPGITLDAWVMYPPDFDAKRSWPLVLHVYAEPWSQTVLDSFGNKHLLFHRWLAQQGYVVASIDPRGTPAPRGRAFRKALHRTIGVQSARELDRAVGVLLGLRPFLDPKRLAVWGWSGGGATTLNLLFRHPDRFAAGMAVAPVTDVALYDTIYQERYLGDPRTSPEVYRASSPIEFANGLRAPLLLVHGTGDDNVHWQHSERLVDALVAHGKRFEYLAYPNRTHAIAEGAGTRAHLYDALADFLRRRVPAGGR